MQKLLGLVKHGDESCGILLQVDFARREVCDTGPQSCASKEEEEEEEEEEKEEEEEENTGSWNTGRAVVCQIMMQKIVNHTKPDGHPTPPPP